MKKVLILAAITFCSAFILKGNKINFAYDAVGNRITRQISLQRSLDDPNDKPSQSISYFDCVGDHDVVIAYNHDGNILVSIPDLSQNDQATLILSTISGIVILSADIQSDQYIIDLNSQPNGIYILLVNVNNENITWKINKQ